MPIVGATKQNIQKAARIIRAGGIAAFPTETVYGLGASAFDARAVKKIFKAKGRPNDNPLIVHIADKNSLWQIAKRPDQKVEDPRFQGNRDKAQNSQGGREYTINRVIKKFWPGPLTIVLPKTKNIPSAVSAGLPSVAVRMPANRIARALIRAAGAPIAAPSANKSGRPSPTTAKHVAEDFGKDLLILDGGKTRVGVESTVVDMTVNPPLVLRQGGVPFERLKKVIPSLKILSRHIATRRAKSPGMKYRHYAPKAPLFIAAGHSRIMIEEIKSFIEKIKPLKAGVLSSRENARRYGGAKVVILGSRRNLNECAGNLFASLRSFDKMKVDAIISENFPLKGLGAAMMDRLTRASKK